MKNTQDSEVRSTFLTKITPGKDRGKRTLQESTTEGGPGLIPRHGQL